jgi:hypothetical protein
MTLIHKVEQQILVFALQQVFLWPSANIARTIGQVPFKQWDQVSRTIDQVSFTNNGTKCPKQ